MFQTAIRILLYIAFTVTGTCGFAQQDNRQFRRIDIQDGLSDNSIQHILQLPDNRMAITTRKCINIYDGSSFRYIYPADGASRDLPDYYGAYHVYVDGSNLLWVKEFQHVRCFDLRYFTYIENIDSIFQARGVTEPVRDLFVDSRHHLWLVKGQGSMKRVDGVPLQITLPQDQGALQDMDETPDGVYAFFSNSSVVCYDAVTGHRRYVSPALDAADAGKYASSSLVVADGNGRFYQLRDGDGGGICLTFDTATRQWNTLFRSSDILHTICFAPRWTEASARYALVTSMTKMRQIDTETMQVSDINTITVDGNTVSAQRMNTVFGDSQGGLWLGSYADGILYSHPSLADDTFVPQTLYPLLVNVTVCGMKLHQGDERMPMCEAYTHELTFPAHQNTFVFEYTALNYPVPLSTVFYYKMYRDGQPESQVPWTEATYGNEMVGRDGILRIQYENLAPGSYHLLVRAGKDSEAHAYGLTIHIQSPWWASIPAIFAAFIVLMLVSGIIAWGINRRYRRRMQVRYEEQILLTRLQTLIERFDMEAAATADTPEQSVAGEGADEFVHRAVELVEKNIGVRGYNVEQLSRDMCMERTGLYKRMTELMDKTPSLFIRSIRLQKAAALLMQGHLSVTEVAERTGFSSPSHMSRCFQAEWGCTPMEYVRAHSQKNTDNQ